MKCDGHYSPVNSALARMKSYRSGGPEPEEYHIITGWRQSGIRPISKENVYKRAGFDLLEARDGVDLTELKAPTTEEEFDALLQQIRSSPPETSNQLRKFLTDCFYQDRRSIDLLQENLSYQTICK
ncbi:hypothetical protein AbraIFM66950_009430 [Aspergillus brasiliensis]|nr:hypothetical protein AbraIFM66950_009430 [Aspergillus brasiliensis]